MAVTRPRYLLGAARQLEALDVRLARETYLEAFTAAMFVGRLFRRSGTWPRAARTAPAPPGPGARRRSAPGRPGAARLTEGYAAGTPALRRALLAFRDQGVPAEEGRRWLGSPEWRP